MSEFALYFPGILMAFSAQFLVLISPGPAMLAIMGASMSAGRASGVALAVGVATGAACWALLAAVGLSAVLTSYADALTIIKILGGLYLLWLGFKAFRAATHSNEIRSPGSAGLNRSLSGDYLSGLAIHLINPKAILGWIAMISLGLRNDAPIWVGAIIVGGGVSLSLLMHVVYAFAFSTPAMVRVYTRARRWIQAVFAAFFTFAGIKLLTSRP